MPQQQEPEPVYIDEHHQRISEFAQDYMDDDERDDFIDQLMERRGYTRIQGWGPPEDPDPQQGGGRQPAPRGRQGGGQQRPTQQRRSAYFKR